MPVRDFCASLHRRAVSHMNPPVWIGSAGVVVTFVVGCGLFPDQAHTLFQSLQAWIVNHLGWFYVLVATGLLIFVLTLPWGRFGQLRLGPPDSRPDFRFGTWLSMLLAAGMGIGIIFFGVSEPLQLDVRKKRHYFRVT